MSLQARQPHLCKHCGGPSVETFCCAGCASVFEFLQKSDLLDYYAVRNGDGIPAIAAGEIADTHADRKWLEPIAEKLHAQGLTTLELDLQGVHCSACVWLLEQLFKRHDGGKAILINTAIGSVQITVASAFDLRTWVSEVERLGYRLGPIVGGHPEKRTESADLVWRMGVCIALAMNTMIFAVAVYCGLDSDSGPTYQLFQRITFGLSTVSVLLGGTVFFRSAFRAVRQRTLHLDVPIALGILLAYGSSAYSFLLRGGATSFFDTLGVFIALMLVGRYLQERVVIRNRKSLLASSGAEHLLTRRVNASGSTDLIRCVDIRAGDRLLIGRGDLVPVDARSTSASTFSLDWINGESEPRRFETSESVPAGAFHTGETAILVLAATDFASSTLSALLRTTRTRDRDLARATPFWSRLTRIYVSAVLALAVAAFAGWLLGTRDLPRTLDVVASILIVTCPCAFGIATPLAYELAQAGLRRLGLFVRSPAFLDRASAVRRVVFDKTGTLTTGRLALANVTEVLALLSAEDRNALANMVARSAHPKSEAIARALGPTTLDPNVRVLEKAGRGLQLLGAGGVLYRLGSRAWAGAIGPGDVSFTRNGALLASFRTTEALRPDAVSELAALARAGYEAWIASGDSSERVAEVAAACAIPAERAIGELRPSEKAALVRSLDANDTLFLGDGINDALVADVATCSGTPAIDRPFMAARSDFYVVTPGLRPIRVALLVAKKLARVVRLNLIIASLYNVITVSLALAGLMSPLLCAVLMPLASVSTVLATTASLSGRNSLWKS